MSGIAEFLLARIAEDEEDAQAASFLRPSGPDPAFVSMADGLLRMQQRFDPPRVLAECEAKRRIVEMIWALPLDITTAYGRQRLYTLFELALPYADHADYDEAWRL